jgi:TRAP-type C4-dicarboxylate transport system permease small subunit
MRNLATQAARLIAICGGLVLTVLIVLICISVIGRSLNGLLHGWIGALVPGVSAWALDLGVGPINGDFELVEAGVAFAIFAFLPLCQISAGHASVDIFTAKLPTRINRVLLLAIEVIFAVVLIAIAYQLYNGMLSKQRYGDTTFLLQFPIWWAYAASLSGSILTAVISLYVVGIRAWELMRGEDILSQEAGLDL